MLKPNDLAKVSIVKKKHVQIFASPFGGSITFSVPLLSLSYMVT